MGEALCRLFTPDDSVDLRAIAVKAKRSIKRYIERERFGKNRDTPPMPTRLGATLLMAPERCSTMMNLWCSMHMRGWIGDLQANGSG